MTTTRRRTMAPTLLLALSIPSLSWLLPPAAALPVEVPSDTNVLLLASPEPDPVEQYAVSELARHVESVLGKAPDTASADESEQWAKTEADIVIVVGTAAEHPLLQRLVRDNVFEPNDEEQGYAIHCANDVGGKMLIILLAGADPLGVLYAVRDFCHYHLHKEDGRAVLGRVSILYAPPVKARVISLSGANLFGKSTYNDHDRTLRLNTYFLDWLSEWKVTHLLVWWCSAPTETYDALWKELIPEAQARGLKVLRGFVPYRPDHEGAPEDLPVYIDENVATEPSNCPREPAAREWYLNRLVDLVIREPRIDGVIVESPYHDGVHCPCPKCKGNSLPETQLLDELFQPIREARPDMTIGRCVKRPAPNAAAAATLAEELKPLDDVVDWYYNTYRDRADRVRWHDIGPKCGTYLRLYRSALKGGDPDEEVDFLFNDFRPAAERRVAVHGFCYRFYGGRYGSFPVEEDEAMMKAYPEAKGPFSLALVCEAAFDPFVDGEARERKIERIRATTIPDYPRTPGPSVETKGVITGEDIKLPSASKLFRYQYGIADPSFCSSQVCVDFDNDGTRELNFASRETRTLELRRAADGAVVWSRKFAGEQQTTTAFDLDGDGQMELIYTTSNPGELHIIDAQGNVKWSWDCTDKKLGNMPVIFDADGDGCLDAYFGSRHNYLFRLDLTNGKILGRRDNWSQCGCQTSAKDVDGDGVWDLFAGVGDHRPIASFATRYDPLILESVWTFRPEGKAASASSDLVLVDLDGDGQDDILKGEHSTHDNAETALRAFEADGTLLWTFPGVDGEDTPNAADLDGDGSLEIVGMTFGCEVYCLDANGKLKWRTDLRPELGDESDAYMAPILCDVDGSEGLEILAITNGAYADTKTAKTANGILFALSPDGEILDRFDVGSTRFWGHAYYCNIDDDPFMELVVSGSGGMDVIETAGYGPNTEHFQRRRTYQRNNVIPWAYEDTYFLYRGQKENVTNRADALVLSEGATEATFTTELLIPPPNRRFTAFEFAADIPEGTSLTADLLDADGKPLLTGLAPGRTECRAAHSLRIEFSLAATRPGLTPKLKEYTVSFGR